VRANVPDITSQVIGERADGTVDRQKSRRLILTSVVAGEGGIRRDGQRCRMPITRLARGRKLGE
jgi:hypothetical protein